ncbi:MAG: 3'-5' exonuclease domain-containing protein 2 [Muribaculaceae bacterium]|nr:3'-5' exonuclease domain-containing protein 2 [Muribaculaceae bacterium]
MTNVSISISKERVATLPTVKFDGAITLVERLEDVAPAVAYLREQDIVGFDTETKPNFRKGVTNKVSLIQVATEDRSFLFRLNKIGFSQELKEFMECNDVLKVGLSLKDDFHVLHKISAFTPDNFIELQDMVKKYGITDASLQKIYAIIFGGRISKSQRLTNWEAPTLTPSQMVYASIDAWACQRIYKRLISGEFNPELSEYVVTP